MATGPRLLYLALGCAKRADNARAVLETWGADVVAPDRVVILGDEVLEKAFGSAHVWPCVKAGGPHDNYLGLPQKVLEAWRRALADPNWEFAVKLDDDTLAVPARMSAIVGELDPSEPLFVGGNVMSARSTGWPHAHLNKDGAWNIPFFSGGAGYVVTRPALKQAWTELEAMLAQPGAEDVFVAAAMHRARVPAVSRPHLFRNWNDTERLFWGATGTIHHVSKENLRLYHRLFSELAPRPFAIANASTGWGDVGLGGVLGYDGHTIAIDGKPVRRALSAHAPSELVLRGEPRLRLELRGALNDSVPANANVWATFTVRARDGRALVDLGRATRGSPTEWASVRFPDDGRLVLHARESTRGHCHTVWLWDAPEWFPQETDRRVA